MLYLNKITRFNKTESFVNNAILFHCKHYYNLQEELKCRNLLKCSINAVNTHTAFSA